MQTYNITALRGDTWNGVQFEILVNQSALDLTGYDFKMELRVQSKVGGLRKTLTLGNGITVLDPVTGIIQIDAFLVDLQPGVYYYDLQLINGNIFKTYIGGKFTVTQDITK